MGCDIHTVLEYNVKADYPDSFGEVSISRNYLLFGCMAGVRVDLPKGPVVEPRGYPEGKWSYTAREYFTKTCLPDKEVDGQTESRYTAYSRAKSWVEGKYASSQVVVGKSWGEPIVLSSEWPEKPERFLLVTNPDYHTPSWLTTEEMVRVRTLYKKHMGEDGKYYPPVLDAIIAAMKALPDARLVFAFDN